MCPTVVLLCSISRVLWLISFSVAQGLSTERACEDTNWDCIGYLLPIMSITRRHPQLPTLTAISFPYWLWGRGGSHVQQGILSRSKWAGRRETKYFRLEMWRKGSLLSSLAIYLPLHVDLLTIILIYQGVSKYRHGENHPDTREEHTCWGLWKDFLQLKVQLKMQQLNRSRNEQAGLIKGLIRTVCQEILKQGTETRLLISIALVPKQNELISAVAALFICRKWQKKMEIAPNYTYFLAT